MSSLSRPQQTPRRGGLGHWVDDRLGLFTAWDRRLNRVVPGGPNWRYVLPSVLAFTFVLEAISGFMMWMFYSSNAQSAWESVFWFQEIVHGGWLVRGIHFYAGHTMVVLAALYVAQLVFTRLYRPPREFIFWAGLLMLFVLLALLLTGDLLRWDQEGFWSTKVRVGFLTMLPKFGGEGFKLAAGGGDFGHLTVSRFLALHVGLFSLLFALLLVWHAWLVRRHALPSRTGTTGLGRSYWPGQLLLNFLGCGIVLAVVGLLVMQNQFRGDHNGQLRGAYLGAPADMAENYEAARPEWAFRALYHLAHVFSDKFGSESIPHTNVSWGIVPIFVIPPILVLLFFLMPLVGRLGIVGHLFNVAVLLVFVLGSLYLGGMSLYEDQHNEQHQAAVRAGEDEAQRVKDLALAPQGIPPAGALALLRNDAKTQGPRLFKQNCASCHNWLDADKQGIASTSTSAPNLFGFATRQWLAGFLDPEKIAKDDYFGKTAFKGNDEKRNDMVTFVKDTLKDVKKDEDEKKQLGAAIASLSAEAGLKSQRAQDVKDADLLKEGRKHMLDTYSCTDCHRVGDKGQLGKGPDLTGYGSRDWLMGIIGNPTHKRFYGKLNDRMPAYEETMNTRQIELIANWLRGEWYEAQDALADRGPRDGRP